MDAATRSPYDAAATSNGSARALLTVEQVAGLLQVRTAWVYAQCRAERIPHVRLGRYVRFRRDAIEHWLANIEAGTDPAPR